MGFEEIKELVNGIYERNNPQFIEYSDINGGVFSVGIEILPDSFDKENSESPFDLIRDKKGIETREELEAFYWNYAAKIYNSNSKDLYSIKQLLEDRREEIKKAYYLRTHPIRCFFLDENIGRSIYERNEKVFLSLLARLCYLRIFQFENLLMDQDSILEKFTDEEIIKSLKGKLKPKHDDLLHDKHLLNCISPAKDYLIKYYDIVRKIDQIEWLLEWNLFDVSKKHLVSSVPFWNELHRSESEEMKKELDKKDNYHIHRKQDIVNKYYQLKEEHPQKNDSEIRQLVQGWYFDLTPGSKSIDEGTIRYYLDEK